MIDLQAIEKRRKMALENKTLSPEALRANAILSGQDIPALIAEVKRLEEKQYEDQATMEHEGEAIRLHKDDRIRMDDGTIKRLDGELKRYRELAKAVAAAPGEIWMSRDELRRRAAELLKEVKPPSEDLRGVSKEVHDE